MSLVALPMISTVIAPTSTMAASGSAVCGSLAPNAQTDWHCNFSPTYGNAAICNNLTCNQTYVGNLCQSCDAKAHHVQHPDYTNMYYCFCT